MALDKLVDSEALDSGLTSIANAIRAKGGTSAALTYPTGFVSAIENIPTGSSGGEEKTVCYYDYDGTLVASYTPAEYAQLSEHPANPTHTGLTAQGWNWTLTDAKEYVAEAGYLDIGQNYVTTSGGTEIDITLDDPNYLHPYMHLYINASNSSLTINWGDGTSETYNINTGNYSYGHIYSQTGNYTITITYSNISASSKYGFATQTADNASVLFASGSTSTAGISPMIYCASIKAIRLGPHFSTYDRGMQNLVCCEYITVPTDIYLNGSYVLYNNCKLIQFTAPNGITSGNNFFYNCYSAISISLSKGCQIYSSMFYGCRKLKSIYFANNTGTLVTSSLRECYSLKYVKLPNNLYQNTLGNGFFYYCRSLKSITIPSSVTSLGPNAFYSLYMLENIVIPDDVTSIGSSCLRYCAKLSQITLPSKLEAIEDYCFSTTAISRITIPENVTSIGSYAFYDANMLCTVENLSNKITTIGTNAFQNSNIEEIHFTESLNSIGTYAFAVCYALKTITISLRVKKIEPYTFQYDRSLTKIINCEGVNTGNNYAFRGCCSLIDINPLIRNRTTLYESEFANCYSAKDIIIPSTVTAIGKACFQNDVPNAYHFRSTTPPTLTQSASTVFGVATGTVMYVPAGCLETYQTATNWSARASYMVEEATVACTGITLDKATETLAYIGDAKKITETITPSNCNQDVIYTSSDPTCVAVNNSGVIDAVETGTCTITATCGTQSATCTVSVPGRNCLITNGTKIYFTVLDSGTSGARIGYERTGETTAGSKYRAITGSFYSIEAPSGCKMVQFTQTAYPIWFCYSTNSISIQCDSSIKATFYFVDIYTGATGYTSYAKYIGGDSGYDDPNVSKGDRTVSIPSGASGCVIELYREDGPIDSTMINDVVVSIA